MSKFKLALGALVVVGLTFGRGAVAEEPTYECQLFLLKTPNSNAQFEAGQARLTGSAFVIAGTFSVRWGDSTFTSDGRSLRWNGQEVQVAGREMKVGPAGAAVTVLGVPRISTRMGDGGVQVKVSTGAPLQYLEREADGRFALRVTPVSPEFELRLILEKASTANAVRVVWRYKVVQGGKRQEIPGVSLDLGAPAIRELTGQGADEIKLDNWCLITTSQSDSPSGLAIFLRINPSR